MTEQIRLLEQLQRIDARIQEAEESMARFPARLAEIRENLGRVENLLADERARLAEAERMYAEQARELKIEEEQIQKTKSKVQQVRNSREYMATNRELETLRRMCSEREEEVLKLLEAVERFRESIAAHDADLTRLRAEVSEQEDETRRRMAEIEAALAGERGERDALAARVAPDIMRRYDSIRRKRTNAVLGVRSSACVGCHMNIPPQLFNTMQRGDELQSCPTCQRILYYIPPDA